MHHKHVIYPFTAIVGQDDMKIALILNAIDPQIGGVLIRGEKGTAKSTAVRGLSDLLPEIEIVAGCPFNCDPNNLCNMCRTCQEAVEQGQILPRLYKKMSVVELPVSATEDRVVGSLDLQKALKEGIRALHPGVLAEANRNILYIDEVNLLDDHVANVLLDAAAMGVNIIEREGISLHHPARFILVGTMNPEEGELRPQLLDRFGLCVEVKSLTTKEERSEVIRRRQDFDRDPWAFAAKYEETQTELRQRIARAREQLSNISMPEDRLNSVAEICANLGIETLRADIVVTKAAIASAALDGRDEVDDQDILKAMELALPHRLRKKPSEKIASKQEILEAVGQMPGDTQRESLNEKTFKVDTSLKLDELARSIEKKDRTVSGRNHPLTKSSGGKYVSARPMRDSNDIAIDATLRRAAIDAPEGKLEIKTEHLMEKIRVGKSGVLYVFCLDSSSSMGAQARMELAKGAINCLLQTAYQRRDKVALISFRGSEAELVLPPTASVETAWERLKELPTGGKTPLSQGILECLRLIERQKDMNSAQIVLISDGRGNLPIKGSLKEDLLWLGEEIRAKGIRLIVINTAKRSHDLGHLMEFAQVASGDHFFLEEVATW